jgi:hypothetical protein
MKRTMLFLGGILLALPSYATVVYTVDTGSLDAQASLTFGAGTLTVTLTNLIVDQTSDGQDINGISFTLPQTFAANIVSDTTFSSTDRSDVQKKVAAGWTDAADTTNHWILTNTAHTFDFTTLGNSHAPYTIIGSPDSGDNEYNNVNSSITMDNHDPLLAITATWVLQIPGVTSADETELTNLIFGFGTSSDVTEDGKQSTTPEPFSFVLAGSGLALLALARFNGRRRR